MVTKNIFGVFLQLNVEEPVLKLREILFWLASRPLSPDSFNSLSSRPRPLMGSMCFAQRGESRGE